MTSLVNDALFNSPNLHLTKSKCMFTKIKYAAGIQVVVSKKITCIYLYFENK